MQKIVLQVKSWIDPLELRESGRVATWGEGDILPTANADDLSKVRVGCKQINAQDFLLSYLKRIIQISGITCERLFLAHLKGYSKKKKV